VALRLTNVTDPACRTKNIARRLLATGPGEAKGIFNSEPHSKLAAQPQHKFAKTD
jgi:hypothetical protein